MRNEIPDVNIQAAQASASYYDTFWNTYGIGPTDECERIRLKFVKSALAELSSRRDLQILDFGCGRGWMAPFLACFGSVTGVDFSPRGIKYARKNYGRYANFVLATDNYGLKSQFDVVVCSEVIEHVIDQSKFLRNVYSFLRNDGLLLLTTPNGNLWRYYKKVFTLQEIENWLTPHQLKALVLGSGFQILRHEGRSYSGFKPWVGMQGPVTETIFSMFSLAKVYGRLILSTALYQVLVAQKPA